MASYDEVSRQIEQAETAMKDAEGRLAKLQSIRTDLGELVGRAEAADGLVSVEWTPQGLADLHLDPRALRLPSADLAEQIKQAIAAATAELREKTRAALEAAGVAAGPPPSPEEVQAQLRQLREQMVTTGRASAAAIDRAAARRRPGGPSSG